MVRQIKTIYKTRCQCCGIAIGKGERVWYKKGAGCRCLACGGHDSTNNPRQDNPTEYAAFEPSPGVS